MTQATILSIGFLTALLITISIYYKNKLLIFTTAAVLFLFANMIYFAFEGVKGWPTDDTREVKGILASVIVINPSSGSDGAIYISLFPSIPTKWYEYKYHREAPRMYYVKYTNDRAAKFEEAKQAMQEGKEVRINGIPPENFANGNDGENGNVEGLMGVVNNLLSKILPNQRDTYKPDVPDVEIEGPTVPPEKGTN